jgi:hypothetical protein
MARAVCPCTAHLLIARKLATTGNCAPVRELSKWIKSFLCTCFN